VQQFNEAAGGQGGFHLHVHVMPRHDGIALLPPRAARKTSRCWKTTDQVDRGAQGM